MISNIELKGFKCFENNTFHLTNMTLLSGVNSSGKSSFMQAIRILYYKKFINGIGIGKDIVSDLCSECTIAINKKIKAIFNRNSELPQFFNLTSSFCDMFAYISASRLGPELMLPITYEENVQSVGEKGENVLNFINKYQQLNVPNQIKKDESSEGIIANIQAWLSIISPHIKFDYKSLPQIDHRFSIYDETRRATNVGYGLSYSLPIIATLLINATLLANKKIKSPLILLENPEAHLHPKGQFEIGQLIAIIANMGVQIIVETHSDHLLNGIRIAVKDNLIDAKNTTFLFFKYDTDQYKSYVEQPEIDEHGFFDEWPEGFFDEIEKALMRLL